MLTYTMTGIGLGALGAGALRQEYVNLIAARAKKDLTETPPATREGMYAYFASSLNCLNFFGTAAWLNQPCPTKEEMDAAWVVATTPAKLPPVPVPDLSTGKKVGLAAAAVGGLLLLGLLVRSSLKLKDAPTTF